MERHTAGGHPVLGTADRRVDQLAMTMLELLSRLLDDATYICGAEDSDTIVSVTFLYTPKRCINFLNVQIPELVHLVYSVGCCHRAC